MSGIKLLLIGATVFQRDDAGKLTAKGLVVDYVQGFSKWFDKVIWATTLFEGRAHTKTVINESEVTPLIVKAKATGWLSDYFALRRFVDRQTVIFLHLPNVWLVPVVLALRRKARGLFVYVANDYIQHSESSRRTRGWLYSKLYRLVHELPIRLADGVIVRGRLNLERTKRLNPNIIETVPIGLNTVLYERTKEPCSGNAVKILYVGKLVEGKGVNVLLQAFSELCKLSKKELRLTIVGAGPEEERLKMMAVDLGIGERVKFLGFVDDRKLLSRLYAEADMVVVPSTDPEGVPRVIEEALLHGTPVIASNLEGIRREFPDGEMVLVPPGDVRALRDTMHRLICDLNFRKEIIEVIDKRNAETRKGQNASEQHARFILARC